jgi:predicted house-cleaning noncanonical NTP pyrophosphatase (MazG superfamily)
MNMIEHNKLVRDKIPEICEANGDTPTTRVLEDNAEYMKALYDKLNEEAQEVKEAGPDDVLGELADALEVVQAIGKACGYSPEQMEDKRAQKFEERGGFDDRIFLMSTDKS